ncbi:DUF1725 domain-containing [Pelobates cultripes]|uniref:DUF1725 domain-containing n=1 Tax=Pelobates cultripes TaxID=61616 RepID=A0AAD1S2U3_PELCU|nr:DUF1725 domain-containing [Pelobates cultripes]
MQETALADSWRVLHPEDRDFTFYSQVHHGHSRLDYIMIAHEYLHLLLSCDIQTTVWSDHAPVLATMRSPLFKPRSRQWRLNTQVIEDPLQQAETREVLQQYFAENRTPDTSPQIRWEAYKCVLQVHFIKICTKRKQEHNNKLKELYTRASLLEQVHRSAATDDNHCALLEARRELKNLLSRNFLYTLCKSHRFYYEHSNKCGRMLARMIQKKRRQSQITMLQTAGAPAIRRPDGIMSRFLEFYSKLYDLPAATGMEESQRKMTRIREYLERYVSRRLTQAQAESLDAPISLEELSGALKAAKENKALGPDGFPVQYLWTFG